MSRQTVNLQLDGDQCISVTLSDSGRISLSDIAAATIGHFEDDSLETPQPNDDHSDIKQPEIIPVTVEVAGSKGTGSWTIPKTTQPLILSNLAMAMKDPDSDISGNCWSNRTSMGSNTVASQSGPVLRPWESAAAASSHVITAQPIKTSARATPPPSYQQHMIYKSANQDTEKENQPIKRRKTDKRPMPGNLSEQISSFYTNIQNSPLSSTRDHLPISALGNLVNPTENTIQIKEEPKTSSSSFHQPWSSISSHREYNTQYLSPSVSSVPAVRSSPIEQQMFPHTLMKITDEAKYQPVTPLRPAIQTNSHQYDAKYQAVTPLKAVQTSSQQYESPGIESRLNNSLGMLGSPNMDSPLTKHPYFSDLQNLLSNECKRDAVPQSLFKMQVKEPSPEKIQDNVFIRERKLHDRFEKLQTAHSEEVRQMSNFFRYQTALIETERFKTLHECKYPGSYKESINIHFDNKLHQVMDRVEKSVELMEKADQDVKSKGIKVAKPRPHLNREAVLLMEQWYSQNLDHPYPTAATVEYLAQLGNAGVDQVKKWFANKRNRNQNTRTLTEIAMKKRKLGQLASSQNSF